MGNRTKSYGFTLVELVVVLAILGILIAGLIMLINPAKQFSKLNDAAREHDIKQIQTALDVYYNDNNCYPNDLSDLESPTVYIKTLPKDPETNQDYYFITNGGDCPQWDVVGSKLQEKSVSTIKCLLEQIPGCVPQNYSLGYTTCVVGGKVSEEECSSIEDYVIPVDGQPSPVPTSSELTPTPGPSSTPVPTSAPTSVPRPTLGPGQCYCPGNYDIRGGNCNVVNSDPRNYCDVGCSIHCTLP